MIPALLILATELSSQSGCGPKMWENIFPGVEIVEVDQEVIDSLGPQYKNKPGLYFPVSKKVYVTNLRGPYGQYEVIRHELAHHKAILDGIPTDHPDLERIVNTIAQDQSEGWFK